MPEMLRRRKDFEALQRSSDSKVHPLVVARFTSNDLDRVRFGLSTGRRLGPAVTRNRVRRRLREILRSVAPRVAPGWDILVIARPGAERATFGELRGGVERVLRARKVLDAQVGVDCGRAPHRGVRLDRAITPATAAAIDAPVIDRRQDAQGKPV